MESTLASVSAEWSSTFNAITDALCLVDLQGNVRCCNRAFAAFVGRTPEEVVGASCCALLHGGPDHPPEWPLPKALETRAHQEAEYLLGNRWVRVAAYPAFDDAGAVVGAVHSLAVIDERKRAEENLRRALTWREEIFQGSRDAIFISDVNSRFTAVNRAACELTGYPRDELLRMRIPDLHEPLDLDAYETSHDRILAGDETVTSAYIKRNDGRRVATEFNNRRIVVEGVTYMHTVARDVTERERTAAALRESEDRYHMLFESANDAILLMKDGRFVDCNARTLEIFGCTRDEIVGHKPEELSPAIQPDGSLSSRAAQARITAALADEPQAFEWLHSRRDGTPFYAEVSLKRVALSDATYLQAIVRDITERRRAQEALRTSEKRLVRAQAVAQMGFVDWNLRTNAVLLSDEARRIHGFVRQADMVAPELVARAVHPDDKELVTKALEQAIHGAKEYDLDHRIVWPDGSVRWVHAHAQLTRDAEGAPETLLGTVVDVTERKRAEDQLREFSQRLNYHVENSPLAVIEWGPDMRLTRWSGEAERIFGWRADEVLGKRMGDFRLVYGEDESTVAEVSAALRHGRKPSRLSANRNYRKDGSVAYCEWYNSSLLGESGEVRSILSLVLDVTERKKAEEALSEKHRELTETVRQLEQSRSMLQLIIESIPTRVFWKDRDLRYLGCNSHFARDAGFSDPHQLVGKDDFAMGWREQADLYRMDDRNVMTSCRPKMNIVEPQTTPAGATNWVSTSKVPLQRADGEVVGILGVYDDITERRRAEEALRESEERYRSLFEQSPIGIYRTTPDGRILLANPALLTMLGYGSFEELAARNLETTGFEPGYPRERFREILERDHELRDFEAVWTTKSGTAVRVLENARAVRGADGAILHYEGTVEDITARTLAEEERRRLSAAIEQAAEAVVVTDREGTIQYVNPAFERVTGYGRDEVLGRTPRMLKSGSHDAAFYKSLWDTITAGEVWSGHLINRRKNGSTYEEETTISPVRGPDGRIVNYVAVKRDVTHEVALQQQLNQAQKMEAVGRLAGGIAHDFNNLLQALLTHAQLLRAHAQDPEHIREEAAKVEQDVTRGTGLIRQLLLFSRQETSRLERIDLNDVALNAVGMLRRLVRENIVFDLELADRPTTVEADRGQLEQVLMNLVVNASDAMQQGGRLVIRTGCEPHGSSWLEVEDNGQGIPEAVLEHIFEPFFTTKEPGKGTGLGLSVVHGIVARHHGRVELDTRPGRGSKFRVLLPHTGAGGFDTAPAAAIGPEELPVGSGERVLVVEDETGAREGLKEILVSLGYDVVAVGSGSEAGCLAAEPTFALLLTDLLLPDVAGHDLAEGLQARWPGLAVVLMSGYAEDEAVRRGIEAGRIRFLQKPFNMQTLATTVRAALSERPPSGRA